MSIIYFRKNETLDTFPVYYFETIYICSRSCGVVEFFQNKWPSQADEVKLVDKITEGI